MRALGGGSTEETPAASYLGSGSGLDMAAYRGAWTPRLWDKTGDWGGVGQGEEASCHPEAQVQGAERDEKRAGNHMDTVRCQQDAG